MLAAGILGLSGSLLKRAAEAGAGAIVTKSVGLKPREGYPNPTVVEVECGLLNAMGLPNPGIREFAREIRIAKEGNVPVIVSVFGENAREFATVARQAQDAGADAVELNVSCPHVEEVGEIASNPEAVRQVVRAVRASVGIPIFVKLSPNVADIVEIGRAAEEGGASALVAVNTLRAMAINVDLKEPILAAKIGGLSGSALKPVALRCVYELYGAADVPIVGCGGISSWRDAAEFILAGSVAVQIGTAVAYEGLEVLRQVTKGLQNWLTKQGIRDLREMVGAAHA